MADTPKPPAEPGSPEDLGLNKPAPAETHEDPEKRTEEKGEPFDGNFA